MDLNFINFESQICAIYYKYNCIMSIFEYNYGTDYRASAIYKIVKYYNKYIEIALIVKDRRLLPLHIWGEICEYLYLE